MFKILAVIFTFTALPAFALPVEVSLPVQKQNFKSFNYTYDFESIVKLSNCSGSLIKFEGMPEDKKAVVLTNGHCIALPGGFLKPGQVLENYSIKRPIGIFDRQMKLHNVDTTKIIFATMTDTDVALYEVGLSYKQIKDQFDVEPLTLSSEHPRANTEMNIISGYWEKGWECSVDTFIPMLKEDLWTWTDSIRYNNLCDTTHGSSGSPIIERNTRTVIGINNTGNDRGERCTMNNPCEVSADGTITVLKGISYGQQTYQIYSCLNKDFKLNLKKRGCMLPQPKAQNVYKRGLEDFLGPVF